MLFGLPEMKEFAEKSNDPRITALYKRMETSRSLAAKWADAHAKLWVENKKLQNRVEELESGSPSHSSTADHPWPPDMWRAMFWMLLNATADSPFCHCGEEPFTRGEQCPTCVAITLRESLRPAKAPPIVTDDSQMEYIRKRFCDVVPGLTSKSWEDIWERVRERFKNE